MKTTNSTTPVATMALSRTADNARPRREIPFSWDRLFVLGLLVVLSVAGGTDSARALTTGNLLTDAGFNTPLTNPLTAHFNVLSGSFVQDTWGEETSSVVAAQSGVTPLEGNGMLRMDDDGLTVTQVWQRVDVSAYATDIDNGLATADLVGSFNVPGGVTGVVGGSRIAFVDAANAEISGVALSTATIGGVDSDPSSWQQLVNDANVVPAGTRILEAQFYFVNSTVPPGVAGYVDAAGMSMTIVPEPATGAMLALGLVGVVSQRRKA